MSRNYETKSPQKPTNAKPRITSYDSGYEHSIEHLVELRLLVEESDEQIAVVEETRELVLSA